MSNIVYLCFVTATPGQMQENGGMDGNGLVGLSRENQVAT